MLGYKGNVSVVTLKIQSEYALEVCILFVIKQIRSVRGQ